MTRTRTQGSLEPFQWDVVTTDCANVTTTETRNTSGIEVGATKEMVDVVIPSFKTKSSKGEVFVNKMASVEEVCSCTFNSWEHLQKSGQPCYAGTGKRKWGNGPYAFPGMGTDLAVSNLDSYVIEASTAAAGGVSIPDIQGLVELVEARKMIPLLKGPINTLLRIRQGILDNKGFQAYARREYQRRKRMYSRSPDRAVDHLSDFLAGNWLKYRYGIMPAVRLAEDILKRRGERPNRLTSRGRSGYSTFDTVTYTSGGTVWNTSNVVTRTCNLSVRAGVMYEDGSVFDPYGFRFSDVPDALWELTPFSFVADWFSNAQDYIRAITPRSGVRIRGSWWGYELIQVRDISYSSTWKSVPYLTEGARPSGSISLTKTTKVRNPGVRAALQFSPSQVVAKGYNTIRVLDSLALIAQLFKPGSVLPSVRY